MSPYPFKAGNCRRSCRQLKLLGISASCQFDITRCLPAAPHIHHTHTAHTPRWTHQSLSICQQMTCIDAGDESLKEFGVQCGCVRCFRGVWQRGCLKVCNTWRALHDADVPMSQLFRQTPLTRLPPALWHGLWNSLRWVNPRGRDR